jgi:hypothetical protein
MPLFICRWQNGDFSAASAQSREEAVELLEEMLPVKLGGFGEQTYRMLCERMYPAYCAAISEIDKDRPNVDDVLKEKLYAARELLSNALRIERDRTVRQTPAAIGPQIRGRQDS